jgi:mannose-6-phosphate isomerase-like protein (cupin superfamily)
MNQTTSTVRTVGPQDGDRSRLGGCENRFVIDGTDTNNRFALVEHTLDVGALAAPVHLHHDEDEYTYVVSGTMGVLLGDKQVEATAGTVVIKPRGQWHTFWNAGGDTLSVLELISPAGLDGLFRSFGELQGDPEPALLAQMAARYNCDIDFDQTMQLASRLGMALG